LCAAALAHAVPLPQKAVKDQVEFNLYNDVLKEIGAGSFAKALADLDTWKQKYPESDYRDERTAYYAQAYAGLGRRAEALKSAGELIAAGLEARFPDPAGQALVIRVLYSATWAISGMPAPTGEELAIGGAAARRLFDYDKPLPGVTPEQWAQARADMRAKANEALLHIAMIPGTQAMAKQPPDCAAAETAYVRALRDYPDRTILSYELGRALSCGNRNPEKLPLAIYHFERAAVVDPTLGAPTNSPEKIREFADNTYVRYHGSDEGLAQLKRDVAHSPMPPAGFAIKSADELAQQQESELQQAHPQIALWKRIRQALTDANGQEYFDSQLKDAAVPPLKGVLLEARPACRPTQLAVAIPMPGAAPPYAAEIILTLDKPLTGMPQLNTGFQWEGVPTSFSKEPFRLTMAVEAAKIQELKSTPCTARGSKK